MCHLLDSTNNVKQSQSVNITKISQCSPQNRILHRRQLILLSKLRRIRFELLQRVS